MSASICRYAENKIKGSKCSAYNTCKSHIYDKMRYVTFLISKLKMLANLYIICTKQHHINKKDKNMYCVAFVDLYNEICLENSFELHKFEITDHKTVKRSLSMLFDSSINSITSYADSYDINSQNKIYDDLPSIDIYHEKSHYDFKMFLVSSYDKMCALEKHFVTIKRPDFMSFFHNNEQQESDDDYVKIDLYS